LPLVAYGNRLYPRNSILIPQSFVDTGATKCVVPRTFNKRTLRLPVVGRDKDVGTAKGKREFDYVVVPLMVIANISLQDGALVVRETRLRVRNVPTWLGADDEDFIVGMSFLRHFDVTMRRSGHIIIRK